MAFDLAAANKVRESLGKEPLTPEEASAVLRKAQGSNPRRDGAWFTQVIVDYVHNVTKVTE